MRHTMHLIHLTGLAVFLLLLAGCGFSLKGYQHASPNLNGLYVEGGEQRGTLAGVIQQQLSLAEVKLATSREQSVNRLRISDERFGQRVISVDANGKVLEYELQLVASFEVMGSDGEERLSPQTLKLTRQLTFGGADELSRRSEAELIHIDMLEDMAGQIIRRLQAQLE